MGVGGAKNCSSFPPQNLKIFAIITYYSDTGIFLMTHRILIVDDHRDVIRLLHSALDSLEHEFEIIEAPSGEEAFLEVSKQN